MDLSTTEYVDYFSDLFTLDALGVRRWNAGGSEQNGGT